LTLLNLVWRNFLGLRGRVDRENWSGNRIFREVEVGRWLALGRCVLGCFGFADVDRLGRIDVSRVRLGLGFGRGRGLYPHGGREPYRFRIVIVLNEFDRRISHAACISLVGDMVDVKVTCPLPNSRMECCPFRPLQQSGGPDAAGR
jgi:hypothetical protein